MSSIIQFQVKPMKRIKAILSQNINNILYSMHSSFKKLFVVTKGQSVIDYENLMAELSSNNLQHTQIILHVSYAYTNKISQYTAISRIVNSNRICLNDILICLAQYIQLDSYSISYSNINPNSIGTNSPIYFHCGTYPLNQRVLCELTPLKEIWIKLRQNTNDKHKQFFIDLFNEETESENINAYDNNDNHYYINANSKRSKERGIGSIIKKLHFWKKLYHSVYDKNGKKVKLTWKEAADITGISHKSLDDYYNIIRYGKYLGFDFNKHKNEKIGVLRGFVKAHLKNMDPLILKQIKSGRLLKDIMESREMETESESNDDSDSGSNCNEGENESWKKNTYKGDDNTDEDSRKYLHCFIEKNKPLDPLDFLPCSNEVQKEKIAEVSFS